MKKDMNDLKQLVYGMIEKEDLAAPSTPPLTSLVIRHQYEQPKTELTSKPVINHPAVHPEEQIQDTEALIEESFSIEEKEKELIIKALEKNHGKRKMAANDLGISERTLYRKLKEYNIEI